MKDKDRSRFAPESGDDYTEIEDAIIEDVLLTIESQIDLTRGKDLKEDVEKDRTGMVSNDQGWCFSERTDTGF